MTALTQPILDSLRRCYTFGERWTAAHSPFKYKHVSKVVIYGLQVMPHDAEWEWAILSSGDAYGTMIGAHTDSQVVDLVRTEDEAKLLIEQLHWRAAFYVMTKDIPARPTMEDC